MVHIHHSQPLKIKFGKNHFLGSATLGPKQYRKGVNHNIICEIGTFFVYVVIITLKYLKNICRIFKTLGRPRYAIVYYNIFARCLACNNKYVEMQTTRNFCDKNILSKLFDLNVFAPYENFLIRHTKAGRALLWV